MTVRDLAGTVALVTGGGRGIGAATARALAASGAAVAVNYRSRQADAEALVAEISDKGDRALAVRADVTDGAAVVSMLEHVEAELGPVDILVVNAPGFDGDALRFAPLSQLSWSDVDTVVSGQLKAFYHPVTAALPGMIKRGRGSIVAVGAAASRRPTPGFMPLAMAKATLDVAVKTLAREVGGQGIRVNGVGPGLVLTEAGEALPEPARQAIAQRSALGRNGYPGEVAEVVCFLASERASFLTGTYVLVDGGTTMP